MFRNFAPRALVMVADANRRAGRGKSAIHRLETITDRKSRKFRGFYQSGIPTEELTLEWGVYLYNCSKL